MTDKRTTVERPPALPPSIPCTWCQGSGRGGGYLHFVDEHNNPIPVEVETVACRRCGGTGRLVLRQPWPAA